jgi:6-phosphogluconolactonase
MARVTVLDDAAGAAAYVAEKLAGTIAAGQRAGRTVHIALAGGSTPRAAYERLAELIEDWSGVELWFSDERAVGPDDPDSNERMVRESLFQRVGTAQPRINRVPTPGTAEELAAAYARELRERVPAGPDGMPVLDVALLGLGEDGHTASLFPHAPTLDVRGELVLPVHDAPKPPPDRVTLTLDVLRAARSLMILATGAGKAQAAAKLLAGPDPATPASLLADLPTLELVLDEAAAVRIPPQERA